jgi:hypothetical protein
MVDSTLKNMIEIYCTALIRLLVERPGLIGAHFHSAQLDENAECAVERRITILGYLDAVELEEDLKSGCLINEKGTVRHQTPGYRSAAFDLR